VLDLGQNTADGDAIAGPLSTMLRRNATLQTLDLRYAGMTDAGAVVLAAALEHNACLELLDARYNPNPNPDPDLDLRLTLTLTLTLALTYPDPDPNPNRYNRIDIEGGKALALVLGRSATRLRVLAKTNAMNDQGAADLAAFLRADPTLAVLAQGQERLWF
tara:strand:- start:145 stop:627 length:483 start_codon:yes stop_codon:yes gene_type:complete